MFELKLEEESKPLVTALVLSRGELYGFGGTYDWLGWYHFTALFFAGRVGLKTICRLNNSVNLAGTSEKLKVAVNTFH